MRKVLAIAFAALLGIGSARAESIQIFGAGASGFSGACAGTSNGQLIFNNGGNCGGITGWTTDGANIITGANLVLTGAITAPNVSVTSAGSATAPALMIGGTNYGLFQPAASQLGFSVAGTTRLDYGITTAGTWTLAANVVGTGDFTSASTGRFKFGTNGLLSSPATGSVQLGAADAAAPVAQTLRPQSVSAGTANTAGTDWTNIASLGTGMGGGGNIIDKTGFSAKSGGTAQGTAVDRNIVVAKGKILTSTNGILLADIALPSLASAGGVIDATIVAANATDAQSFGQTITYSAVNKLGTIISSITASTGDKSVSTGTLTTLWGLISGANKITLVMTPTSSIAPTANSFLLYFQIRNNSEQATTIL